MDQKTTKKQVISSVVWKFCERFSAQFVTLVVTIVLARLLDPHHYGTVSIMLVFINIANVFVTESFSAALIQKKDVDTIDFSTIFYFNILFSVGLYIVVFVAAPWVERFYDMPELANAMRILALKIPISAIYSVQQAYVSRNLLFKKFFFATIIGTVLSAAVGIIMALRGFGVYALVAQYLTNSLIGTVVLWFVVRWRPVRRFSYSKFKGLFGYGWKILFTSLLRALYEDIYSLVIGKKYTDNDLAFYSKGKHYPQLIITNVNSTISSVMFPALSKIQDDTQALCLMMRRAIKTSAYILSPMMIGMAVVAEPLVMLVLTDKWLPCVPYLRLACLYLLLMPMQSGCLQAIKAAGRSDIVLKLEIAKRVSGILILIITMQFGVLAIAWGSVLTTLLASFFNAPPVKRLAGYTYLQQVTDILPSIVLAVVACVPVFFIQYLNLGDLITLVMQIVVAAALYVGISIITRNENFYYVLNTGKSYVKKKNKSKP